MPGPDLPETPRPEIPEEFAATYAEAYRRALESGEYDELDTGIHPVVLDQGYEQESAAPFDGGAGAPGSPADGFRRWSVPLLVAVLAVLLIGGAYGVGRIISDDDAPGAPVTAGPSTGKASPTAHPTSEPSPTPSAEPVPGAYSGSVEQVAPEQARASCRSRASIDSAGRKVRYLADNTLDDDPSTAWRCGGDAIGETIRFEFDEDTEIVEVGLIPGYAKTDPVSGVDRYAENNRITRVRWTLADGVTVEQTFDPEPSDRGVQSIRVPRTETDEVTLEILEVAGGPRNTTAISTALFGEAD